MKKKKNSFLVIDKILSEGKINANLIIYFSLSFLFIISFIYFYFFGNGIFIYQENNSLFIYSGDYLQKFISKPGGLLVFAGNFLTQFYFNPLYGSLILSTLLISFYLVFIKIISKLDAYRPFSLLFILLLSCLLLLLQTRYDFYTLNSLGYLLISIWFFVTIVTVKTSFRFIFIGLFPVIYYIVGSFVLIYIVLLTFFSLIYEKGILRYYSLFFLSGIILLTFIIFKNLLFLQPLTYLLGYPLFFNDFSKLTTYSYLFSACIILFPLLISIADLLNLNKILKPFNQIVIILILYSLTIFLLVKNQEPEYENLMKLEKLVYDRNWEEVINRLERNPSTNIIGQYYYNLALTEKGLLCERLFFGPQNFGPITLTLSRDNEHMFRAIYFYYAIGQIGEAHHLAYELMVQHGYRPENIKMLIKTELINGNYKIAERYINVLNKTLHYKNWAAKYQKMLFNPALISSDTELGEKIRLLPKSDFFVSGDDVRNLDYFLKANPDNKKAFEVKMARLLLEKDLLEVISEVKKIKDIGNSVIPRHIEEAILAFIYFSKQFPDFGGLSFKPETQKRFEQYLAVYNYYGGKKALLDKVMKKTDKNTFWYYLQFNVAKLDYRRSNADKNFVY